MATLAIILAYWWVEVVITHARRLTVSPTRSAPVAPEPSHHRRA
jgi:hypothetical protein